MTATLQEAQLDAIIRRVLEKMDVSRPPVSSAYRGVFATADQALEAVYRAQIAYRRGSIAKRKAIIDAIREVVIENAQRLAQMAVEETRWAASRIRCSNTCWLRTRRLAWKRCPTLPLSAMTA